jgi:transposase InsO family protein
MSKSTYYYKENLVENKYESYDKVVLKFINDDPKIKGKKGYREVMSSMRKKGKEVRERRIRKVMKENGLLAYQSNSMNHHNSYKNDGVPPAPNYLYDKDTKEHFFAPDKIWELMGTDVTEFYVNGFKVYLSQIIDFFDSAPICWRIGKHPDTDLIVGTVQDLIDIRPSEEGFLLHMDQGSVNRSHAMVKMCSENKILRSMSGKGKSGDNAPTEGFFGRLKQEWFNKTDFTGYTYEKFVKELDEQLNWHYNERTVIKLGGISPASYRSMIDLNNRIAA